MKTWLTFWYGIFKNNPTFRLVLGLCPTLAVTTSLTFSELGGFLAQRTASAYVATGSFLWTSVAKLIAKEIKKK